MNKVINIFSGIVIAIYSVITMALVYDLSLSTTMTLKSMPYQKEITIGLSLLVLLLGLVRIRRRWQGMRDMRKFGKFTFVRGISNKAKNSSVLFTLGELFFMLAFFYFLGKMTLLERAYTTVMLLVMLILIFESIIFLIKIFIGGDAFRIGINKKVVAYFNREMYLFYFTGLRRIEMHQDMINFQYKGDLNLFLPLEILKKEDRAAFRDALIETLEAYAVSKNGRVIYIDEAFRKLA